MVVEHAHGLRQRRGPNAKSSLHKAHLAPDAGLQAPGASLSFAQGSHDFESLDRGIGRGDRFETAHRLDQYLELSVIGLDHVIEILHLPVGRLPVQLSFALQFGDRCTIARRFVGIERGRLFPVLQASQGLAQEPLRCLGAAGRRQVEIDRVAPLVDCPVQVGPLAPHLDVGFIQAPARIKATPPEPAQPLLHLRGVALDPAIDRRMVDRNAAFRQHFLKVAIADRIATIPAHRPQDHITLEMAPLEIRHRSVRPISAKHAQASRFLQQSHYVEGLPTESGKYVARNYTEVGGGPAATAAVAAARLGAQVDFIGRVGDDDTGNSLLAELESWGVNTRYTKRYNQAKSSQSAIMVDTKGERIIINYPSPDLLPDAEWLEEIDFSQWDVVLADVRWHDGAKKAFTLARQAGVMTVLDGDITPQDISELVALSDHAAFSEPGLARLTGVKEMASALKQAQTLTNGHVYVTQGSAGCDWLENGGRQHQPAFKVDVVDTTGAGDVFHGALAVALATSGDLAESVRFASGVAALKCTRPGGRAGIPDCDQTRSFLSLFV